MKVKMIASESLLEVEHEINNFLSDRRDIKVIDIREISSDRRFIFMVMYEYIQVAG
jgi:hypothetical protein